MANASRYEILAERINSGAAERRDDSSDYQVVLNVLEVMEGADPGGSLEEFLDELYEQIALNYEGEAAGFFERRRTGFEKEK